MTLTFKPVKWLTLEGMVAPRYVTTNNHTFVKKMKFYSDAFGTVSNSSNVAFNYLDESANRSFYGNYQFTAALQHTFAQNHNFNCCWALRARPTTTRPFRRTARTSPIPITR